MRISYYIKNTSLFSLSLIWIQKFQPIVYCPQESFRIYNYYLPNIVKNKETKVNGFENRELFSIGQGSLSKFGKVLEVCFEIELHTFSS